MGRYDLPMPKCDHARLAVRVTSGDLNGDGPHASVIVCGREACIEDAKEWAFANTHIHPTTHPIGQGRKGESQTRASETPDKDI